MEKLKHNERELKIIKDEVAEMWRLVLSQLQKCKQAYLTGDAELAREIISREKRINSFELKIDSDCENYIALFAPVAVDLRLVLSLMKISGALERIGDFAEGIALHVVEGGSQQLAANLKEDLKIETMFDIVISMLSDSFVALESENTKLSGRILQKDDEVDSLYREGKDVLAEYIKKYPEQGRNALETFLILRRLERIGDHCSNTVEEIVFYIDAKILKHSKKKQGAAENALDEP
ncbi:MAG: phosphate signaling complex protein PhoU [Fibromonadaceae bacterium]|jgi:phosphate transport system protein|nr:phosphate signaling complex protein PhoU [Fibromonadaceae bacterium]